MATQVSLNDGAVASAGALAIQTNGTTQAVSISTGQVATLAQNPILTSGTANGVAYLNGSKVLTTGSALVFDGTVLTLGTSSALPITGSKFSIGNDANSALRLAISNQNAGASALVGIDFEPAGGGWKIDVPSDTSGFVPPMYFKAGASTNVTFAYGGNVGIGTTSPSFRLHAVSSAAVVSRIGSSGGSGAFINFIDSGASPSVAPSVGAIGNSLVFMGDGSSSERARIDSSGNVGIGTSSPSSKLNVYGNYIKAEDGTYAGFFGKGSNVVASGGTADLGISTTTGNILFGTGASIIERARIDSGGKFLLGVTSGTGLSGGDFAMGNGKSIRFRNAADSAYISAFEFTSANGLNIGTGGSLSTITFGISGIGEAGRFDASGNLLVGTNGQTNLERLGVVFTGNNEGAYFANGSASPTGSGITVNFSNATGTNGTACILYKGRTAGADRFYVYGNGNVVNINNSYGSLSDIKHKENIVDATPKLEKLNQVRVVNFNIKGDSQKQIGVIAQELEQVFPSMVDESPDRDAEGNDLGTTTKSVKYSVFVPILIKAIQEQQALITQLTARITALEGA